VVRLVTKWEQLVSVEGEASVSPALVVAELDLIDAGGQPLDYGADLAAPQTMESHVFQQSNHG
jgi:hypothetical protein